MLNKDDIKFLIVHCSDTPDNQDVNAEFIHQMHLDNGWDGIGYHKVILRSGIIENGRPEFWKGAHAYKYNDKSVGVCLIGKNKFTLKQQKSLKKVLNFWKKKYPLSRIIGHRDLPNTDKTCPNFDVKKWLENNNI